jgi:hypothetical protein
VQPVGAGRHLVGLGTHSAFVPGKLARTTLVSMRPIARRESQDLRADLNDRERQRMAIVVPWRHHITSVSH